MPSSDGFKKGFGSRGGHHTRVVCWTKTGATSLIEACVSTCFPDFKVSKPWEFELAHDSYRKFHVRLSPVSHLHALAKGPMDCRLTDRAVVTVGQHPFDIRDAASVVCAQKAIGRLWIAELHL